MFAIVEPKEYSYTTQNRRRAGTSYDPNMNGRIMLNLVGLRALHNDSNLFNKLRFV